MKPIIDIWSNCIDDRDVFDNDKDLEIPNIRLTPEEETDLYEILALDKVSPIQMILISPFTGKSS